MEELRATTSRNDKVQTLSSFLKRLSPSEISPTVLLMTGSVFPEKEDQVLEISGKTLLRLFS